jgi:hypothetical protein
VPLGTQILTRLDTYMPEGGLLQMAGAVAVILQMPSHTPGQYRVRFPDGGEASLKRTDFQVRKDLAKTILTASGTSQAANLRHLNSTFKLSYLAELIARKSQGVEKSHLEEADMAFHEKEYTRLQCELEQASQNSHLPERPSCQESLNDRLVGVRLNDRFGRPASD